MASRTLQSYESSVDKECQALFNFTVLYSTILHNNATADRRTCPGETSNTHRLTALPFLNTKSRADAITIHDRSLQLLPQSTHQPTGRARTTTCASFTVNTIVDTTPMTKNKVSTPPTLPVPLSSTAMSMPLEGATFESGPALTALPSCADISFSSNNPGGEGI